MRKLFKKRNSIPPSLYKLTKELKRKAKKKAWSTPPPLFLQKEKNIVQYIQNETIRLNENNVTRTQAYLRFYLRYPEIHWALLGHMVSRNGGWNMTDLKGGLLSRLLSKNEMNAYFHFLERGNWLIFQDVYPQFLLYEESLKRRENLFYLLQHFHVSSFMDVIWNYFLKTRNSCILTIALIINEQSYLEERVMNQKKFQDEVFNTIEFKLQDLLSLNHVLFPFEGNRKVEFIGQTLHQFQSLHERILLGKRLYRMLFSEKNRFEKIKDWAQTIPHSGSRKDYWPHIFNDVDEGVPGNLLRPRLKSCQIVSGSPRIYSPKLKYAWDNQTHEQAEISDWFTDWKVVYYFLKSATTIDEEIVNEYCKTLERLELAAITKNAISFFD